MERRAVADRLWTGPVPVLFWTGYSRSRLVAATYLPHYTVKAFPVSLKGKEKDSGDSSVIIFPRCWLDLCGKVIDGIWIGLLRSILAIVLVQGRVPQVRATFIIPCASEMRPTVDDRSKLSANCRIFMIGSKSSTALNISRVYTNSSVCITTLRKKTCGCRRGVLERRRLKKRKVPSGRLRNVSIGASTCDELHLMFCPRYSHAWAHFISYLECVFHTVCTKPECILPITCSRARNSFSPLTDRGPDTRWRTRR